MLVQFTVGSTATTLADDINAQSGGKIAFNLSEFTLDSAVMIDTQMFQAATAFKAAKGNIDGKVRFQGSATLASRAAVLTFLATLAALVNSTGSLTFVEGAVTLTLAGAILKSARWAGSSTGTRVSIDYAFEFTTATAA